MKQEEFDKMMAKPRRKNAHIAIDTEVLVTDVEPGTIMTEEQFWDSSEGDALIEFLASDSTRAEYLPSPQRQAELAVYKGFRPEYLKKLFSHLAIGKTYQSFGGGLFIPRTRIRKWEQDIPEWNMVKEMGEVAHKESWEKRLIDIVEGNFEKGNATALIAKMKSIFDSWNPEKKTVNLNQHMITPNADGKMELNLTVIESGAVLENDQSIEIEP
jgi:hypothetical protein